MSARPILFSGPMVRALLAGTKTQTRRTLKPQPPAECSIHYMLGNESWLPPEKRSPLRHHWEAWGGPLYEARPPKALAGSFEVKCPYGAPGDLLWVREAFTRVPATAYRMSEGVHQTVNPTDRDEAAIYAAGWDRSIPKWKPSIHMPRWASRLTLEITDVRVERLQAISEADAEAEGLFKWEEPGPGIETLPCWGWQPSRDDVGFTSPVFAYRALWNHINGPGSWVANPWVWAVSFAVHRSNVDHVLAARAA